VYLGYSIDDEFAAFAGALREYVQLDVLYDDPLTEDDLVGYKVVIINLGSNWYGAFTGDEAKALADFVGKGGGIFIMGDNPGCPNANINGIAAYFDMEFGVGNGDYQYQYVTVPGYTDLILETQATGEMGGPARDWCEDINSVITGRFDLYMRGRAVGVGDINVYDADTWNDSDNVEIARHLFMFLLQMIP
jgi:hypothetical protein